ncbi:MAG: class I SAM-dependent methyltransferase, partial [Clostridiales bacterium]|nr:class I SAM-dependent methyltransferase [Clostridiales bacterium]
MGSYNYFSKVYDELTENVNYKIRSKYIAAFFDELGIKKESTVIDLACGTGTFSKILSDMGYSMIGIDSSEQMLSEAFSKLKGKIPLLNQKMQNFNLNRRASACICCLDSLNHLNRISEITETFKCVYN